MRIALRQHPVISIVAVVIVVALVWGFWPQAVLVEAIMVKRAPLTVTIEEEGRTRVIDRYVISAPVDGVACRMQLHVGDTVVQDEILLGITPLESQVLDPRSRAETESKVAAAKAALRAAEERARAATAAAQLASSDLKRLQPLVDKGLVSREGFDRATTESQTSSAAKHSADFSVGQSPYFGNFTNRHPGLKADMV